MEVFIVFVVIIVLKVNCVFDEFFVDCFCSSMVIDYEKWYDGIGYDFSLIVLVMLEECVEIEKILLVCDICDWCDVEVFVVFDLVGVCKVFKGVLKLMKLEIGVVVINYVFVFVMEVVCICIFVIVLCIVEFFGGLSGIL